MAGRGPAINAPGGTAGGIGAGGAVVAVEAARQGWGWGTIIGILVVTAVAAVAAFIIINKRKNNVAALGGNAKGM